MLHPCERAFISHSLFSSLVFIFLIESRSFSKDWTVHLTVVSIIWELWCTAFSSICLINHLPRFFWSFHIRSQRAGKLVIVMQRASYLGASVTMVSPELTVWTWKLFPSLYGSSSWRVAPSEPQSSPFETRTDSPFSPKRYMASLAL